MVMPASTSSIDTSNDLLNLESLKTISLEKATQSFTFYRNCSILDQLKPAEMVLEDICTKFEISFDKQNNYRMIQSANGNYFFNLLMNLLNEDEYKNIYENASLYEIIKKIEKVDQTKLFIRNLRNSLNTIEKEDPTHFEPKHFKAGIYTYEPPSRPPTPTSTLTPHTSNSTSSNSDLESSSNEQIDALLYYTKDINDESLQEKIKYFRKEAGKNNIKLKDISDCEYEILEKNLKRDQTVVIIFDKKTYNKLLKEKSDHSFYQLVYKDYLEMGKNIKYVTICVENFEEYNKFQFNWLLRPANSDGKKRTFMKPLQLEKILNNKQKFFKQFSILNDEILSELEKRTNNVIVNDVNETVKNC